MVEGLRQSGLVVVVPEAERVVGQHRGELDANAVLGVPAHVTVLFPFVPPERVDADVLARLADLFAGTPAFDYAFGRTAWFEQDVLWLAPDDPAPFRLLTNRVFEAFPAHPPFEGAFADVVPHLTVGHGVGLERLRAAERELLPLLPVTGRATEVTLLAQGPEGRWVAQAGFPLGSHT
jgi:2'-5' RNA ligase